VSWEKINLMILNLAPGDSGSGTTLVERHQQLAICYRSDVRPHALYWRANLTADSDICDGSNVVGVACEACGLKDAVITCDGDVNTEGSEALRRWLTASR